MLSVQYLEELAMNAWPSLQTVFYDGWVLRFADGYTKRANSVHPLYPTSGDAGGDIDVCEDFYRARNLRTIFKMTPASRPANLDALLAARGYRMDSPTSVQVLDLQGWQPAEVRSVTVSEAYDDTWFAAACRLGAIPTQRQPTLSAMLRSIVPRPCYASISHEGAVVACGLGVLQQDCAGLFDIVTDATVRRRGYGQALVQGILDWSKQQGARFAYLQVVVGNEPALRLYARLGFTEQYQYWYRVQPTSEG